MRVSNGFAAMTTIALVACATGQGRDATSDSRKISTREFDKLVTIQAHQGQIVVVPESSAPIPCKDSSTSPPSPFFCRIDVKVTIDVSQKDHECKVQMANPVSVSTTLTKKVRWIIVASPDGAIVEFDDINPPILMRDYSPFDRTSFERVSKSEHSVDVSGKGSTDYSIAIQWRTASHSKWGYCEIDPIINNN